VTLGAEGVADDPLTGFAFSCSGFCALSVSLKTAAPAVTGTLAFFFARVNTDEYAAKAPGTGAGIPASLCG